MINFIKLGRGGWGEGPTFAIFKMNYINFKLMIKSFNDCLFVLKNMECSKIVHFIPTKLLNLKINLLKAYGVCSIQNKFV